MAKKPRIKTPKSARLGEVFQVKTLVSHAMETGQRKSKKTGKAIPRNILNKLEVTYTGRPVFTAHMEPGVSANPYLAFHVKATESGDLVFKWTEDSGKVITETRRITVQ